MKHARNESREDSTIAGAMPVADGAVARTLPAMMALQSVVAMGAFALSVLAPQLGVGVQTLGWLGSALFAVGAVSSLSSGWLIRRLGDLQLAALCCTSVMLAMLCLAADAALPGPLKWSMLPAVLLLGLAFGPETPASASVLTRVTPLARRPWVFSIRQTGNQIGAIVGALALPVLLPWHASAPFALVAVLALGAAAWCVALVARDGGPKADARVVAASAEASATATIDRSGGNGLREVAASPLLRMLTATTVLYMAGQVSLNFFVMSHAVRQWQLAPTTAASWVALMQLAGLAGRLFWGRVAQRPGVATSRVLAGMGIATGVAGVLLFLWPGTPPSVALALLLASLGFTASGWNGVMVAEIARVAGAERAGAVTGAVLLFGYSGLALAPLVFAAASEAIGTGPTFAVLLAAAAVMGALLWRVVPDAHR